jgi:hypothetical protein
MKSYLIICFIIIWIAALCIPASAFSYKTDEVLIPWGTEAGQVYTDLYTPDSFWASSGFFAYTTAWGKYEGTAYILDLDESSEGSLIQYNFDTGQLIEESIGEMMVQDSLQVPGSENEYIITDSIFEGYTCYDRNFNKVWGFTLPEDISIVAWGDLYKLNDSLWGVVVKFFTVEPPRFELWKLTTAGEIITKSPVLLPAENSRVVDISPKGEITWSPYTDKYGGVYTFNDQGNYERQQGGQVWEFVIAPNPEEFFLGPTPAKPSYDGTVFTFEYTYDGIILKRYTLIPESGEPASPEPRTN